MPPYFYLPRFLLSPFLLPHVSSCDPQCPRFPFIPCAPTSSVEPPLSTFLPPFLGLRMCGRPGLLPSSLCLRHERDKTCASRGGPGACAPRGSRPASPSGCLRVNPRLGLRWRSLGYSTPCLPADSAPSPRRAERELVLSVAPSLGSFVVPLRGSLSYLELRSPAGSAHAWPHPRQDLRGAALPEQLHMRPRASLS